MTINFPTLSPEDIEVKIKQISKAGAVALLYKTARTDMDYLDKYVGVDRWENTYQEIHGNLFCTITVTLDDGTKVSKQDCGIESREDGEGNEKKGEASDAFKRAGFRFGIGRELYSAPFTFLKVPTQQVPNTNKWEMTDKFARFAVSQIGYDKNRKINYLVIVNTKTGEVVYSFGNPPSKKTEKASSSPAPATVKPASAYDSKQALNAFLSAYNLTPTQFAAWRAKALQDPANNIPTTPSKDMTPEEWKFMLEKLALLEAEGYFNDVG